MELSNDKVGNYHRSWPFATFRRLIVQINITCDRRLELLICPVQLVIIIITVRDGHIETDVQLDRPTVLPVRNLILSNSNDL